MIYDVIIIGGGSSGIFIFNLLKDKNILLLEKKSSLAKKLLISGNGMCNFTHYGNITSFFDKYGNKKNFIKKALKNFNNDDTIIFFRNLGVDCIIRDDNKVFPKSLNSSDILNSLITKKYMHKIRLNSNVLNISKNEIFHIETEKEKYRAKNIVIATGGASFPKTGSTGDGYKFAKKFGHTISQITEALTRIYIKDFDLNDYSGIVFKDTNIILKRNNKFINTFSGDLLITHNGFSGPIILDNSRYIQKNDTVEINFSNFTFNELENKFLNDININGKKKLITFIRESININRLSNYILEKNKLNGDIKISEINKNSRKQLLKTITSSSFTIEEKGNFNIAMATHGGVNTNEINKNTMESKLIPQLYFIGEILDVDGNTGGYNIQWAFSSAKLAYDNIIKNI